MKDRIFDIMRMVGKNPTDFATTIEISPAVLSSIKSGRTKPTLFLVEKIKSVYPNININWLITGEGQMFTDEEQQWIQPAENSDVNDNVPVMNEEKPVQPIVRQEKPEPVSTTPVQEPVSTRPVEEQVSTRPVEETVPTRTAVVEEKEQNNPIKPGARKIGQIIVLYNDGTYETLTK